MSVLPIPVEQNPKNPRLLNVEPKATKWARNTPFSAFKTDLILHCSAIKLPKQKWGIDNLVFLDNACRTTFLSILIAKRGLRAEFELVAQEQIIWGNFSCIITKVHSEQVTNYEIRTGK